MPDIEDGKQPVTFIPGDEKREPEDGAGLCLSGGGYRAMVFHLGALWRLNELGILSGLKRISSVSGGSITAAVLGLNWRRLQFDGAGRAANLESEIVAPVRSLAGRTIDTISVLGGVFGPGSVSDKIAGAYRKHLYGDATLQDLPDHPRFVINATNVQSMALWRFSKPFMRDWKVGEVRAPKVPLAIAVAASSAFPPILSPVELDLDEHAFTPGSGDGLQRVPYTTKAILTDGGVYDNLGLETVWKRYKHVLVSDGGGIAEPEADPKRDWAQHAYRILSIIDNQVPSLRKRQIMDGFRRDKVRTGAYWSVWTGIDEYGLAGALPCPLKATLELASIATRLKALEERTQERLINWGYAAADASIRTFTTASGPAPKFPYPGGVE